MAVFVTVFMMVLVAVFVTVFATDALPLIDILVKGFLLCFPAFVRLRLSAAQHFRPWLKGKTFSNINVVRMSGSNCVSIGGGFG